MFLPEQHSWVKCANKNQAQEEYSTATKAPEAEEADSLG